MTGPRFRPCPCGAAGCTWHDAVAHPAAPGECAVCGLSLALCESSGLEHLSDALVPGDAVSVALEVHTATGAAVVRCAAVVLEVPSGPVLRVRFVGDAAARFGALHWVRPVDCERVAL